ncbi:MAG: replicative DNA helicase [Bacteroidia bacterium]
MRKELSNGGKLPPQAIELEEAVLGAILLERGTIDKVVSLLEPNDFYSEPHKEIYKSILSLYHDKKDIDILTVTNDLRTKKILDSIGGTFFIVSLTNRIASAANVEYHSHIVKEKSITRKTIQVLSDGLENAFNENDTFDLVGGLIKKLESNIDLKKTQIQHISKAGSKVFDQMESNRNLGHELIGLPSCLKEINKNLMGYCSPDLIIVGARPGEGKTTLAVNEAFNIAKSGTPVLFFSMEMKGMQIASKVLSSLAETDIKSIRSGRIVDDKFTEVAYHTEKSLNIPFYIVDASGLSTMEIKAITKSAIKEYGVKMIFVDYIQISKGSKAKYSTREEEVSDIAKDLKGIAMECDIPVMALSQMARLEKGTYRLPQLSDLKESGGLEANADIVIFPSRPFHHGVTEVKGFDIQFSESDALIIIAKYRLGFCGATLVIFEGEFNRFRDKHELPIQDFNFTDREPIF